MFAIIDLQPRLGGTCLPVPGDSPAQALQGNAGAGYVSLRVGELGSKAKRSRAFAQGDSLAGDDIREKLIAKLRKVADAAKASDQQVAADVAGGAAEQTYSVEIGTQRAAAFVYALHAAVSGVGPELTQIADRIVPYDGGNPRQPLTRGHVGAGGHVEHQDLFWEVRVGKAMIGARACMDEVEVSVTPIGSNALGVRRLTGLDLNTETFDEEVAGSAHDVIARAVGF